MITEVVARVARRTVSDLQDRSELHWADFALAAGLLDAWEASSDDTYLGAARRLVDAWQERGPTGVTTWGWLCMGIQAARLFDATGEPGYRQFALAAADHLLAKGPGLEEGIGPGLRILEEALPRPLLCRAAALTGDPRYFDATVDPFRTLASHLRDDASGLFFHCYDAKNEQHTPCLWARGNGWLALGCLETLALLPPSHDGHPYLTQLLMRQLASLRELQDPGGLWHTVIDRPDSYIETSAGAMFALVMVRGVRLGVLGRDWLTPASGAWRALQGKVSHDGLVFGVSLDTYWGDFDGYQSVPTATAPYGTGFFLQLGVEMGRV